MGLTAAEAAERLRVEGPNELAQERRRSVLRTVLEVVRQPMFLLLLGCGTIYLVLGDLSDALTLLSFVVLVMGITIYQERKTERAVAALRELSSPRALVVRDGVTVRVPGREVVRGDTVLLAEGDRVPADARVLECAHLEIDESLLTGESVPVRKRVGSTIADARPGGDDTPLVWAGTLVVKGHAQTEATATGARSELGKIGKALEGVEPERTLVEREVDRLVRVVAIIGALLCVTVVLVFAIARGQWLEGLLAGLTLAMAMLPEEFPVVLTVFLALGAWRLSKHRVLARRTAAIETLGAATALCVDKTGTLTKNKMTVARLEPAGGAPTDALRAPLAEELHALVELAALASQKKAFDPVDAAIQALFEGTLAGTDHEHADWALEREYPLSPELLALSHVWRAREGAGALIAAKGAPEAIADLCHLPEAELEALRARVTAMADDGLRVLAVARAEFDGAALPANQHDFAFELAGLVGLADPVRDEVPAAVAECTTAGVRVIMITGDYPGTARSVARQVGIPHEEIVTGPELDAMSDAALAERAKVAHVFARVMPEQKLRIVRALAAAGEVVGMTGDGVNDAPALKAAHIGVAMGARGTDVAREAAALVLTDDDFASIVVAVRSGRRIFDNLKKALAYIVAVHIPIAGLSLVPVLLGWPAVLAPVHVVFLEMVIDPACSIVFEAEAAEADVMTRPPRPREAPLFGARTVALSVLQGLVVLGASLGVLVWVGPEKGAVARSAAFACVLAGNLGLIVANRSLSRSVLATLATRNAAMWWVTLGASAFLVAGIYTPGLQDLFHLVALPAPLLLVSVGVGFGCTLWVEALKLRRKHV